MFNIIIYNYILIIYLKYIIYIFSLFSTKNQNVFMKIFTDITILFRYIMNIY